MAFKKGYLDVAQNLFPAAQGVKWFICIALFKLRHTITSFVLFLQNVPRQLFSLSNTKFHIYWQVDKVKQLEEFVNRLIKAYEARDQYEKRITEIFPGYVKNDASYNRRG